MAKCKGCGADAKRGTDYCGPLCAIGTPPDTTHAATNPALIEPDPALQDWANRQWTEKLALERAGFTTDEAIQYLAAVKHLGGAGFR
jgi:hypothetical protein